MTPLKNSPFSYHFSALILLGSWLTDKNDSKKIIYHSTYRLLITIMEGYGIYGLLHDLYLVLGDMKKMTWNLCVTTLLIGMVTKNVVMIHRNNTINTLRLMLHNDAESRTSAEEIAINNAALKEFKGVRIAFYSTAIIFMPTWYISRFSSYFYGVKELPIPFRLPWFIDINNDVLFHVVYVVLGFSAVFGMMMGMECELAMYGLLVQISREYDIFLNHIPVINQMYYDKEETVKGSSSLDVWSAVQEINPCLKKLKTKMLVKKFCARQSTLIKYTEAFEYTFNFPLLQQFFGMSVLIIALALQCLWDSVDISGNLLYQIGYLYINIMDMYLMCWFSTRLRTKCLEVGEKFYSTLWYRMPVEVQKDIAMIILRSQHPPKITTGKFMELSLNAFINVSSGNKGVACLMAMMETMSHLYSWLALFRQLE